MITRRDLLRDLLLGTLGYAGLSLTGCASQTAPREKKPGPGRSSPQPAPEPEPPLPRTPLEKEVPTQRYIVEGHVFDTNELIVTPGHKHARTFKSQEAGEADLEGLANDLSVNMEETWLFIKTDQGEEAWLDVGIQQTDVSVIPDRSFLTNFLNVTRQISKERGIGLTITNYHLHPLTTVARAYAASLGRPQYDKIKLSRGISPNVLDRSHLEIFSMPSPGDIVAAITYQRLRKKGLTIMSSRVMGPGGLFVYEAQPALERLWIEKGDDGLNDLSKTARETGFKAESIEAALNVYREAGLDVNYQWRRNIGPIIVE